MYNILKKSNLKIILLKMSTKDLLISLFGLPKGEIIF